MLYLRKALHGDGRLQKYCKECQQKQARSKKISSNAQYAKANYKTLKLYVSAKERDAIKAYAESLGMSVNKLLLTALAEYQNHHGGSKDE